jgi:hypothetical protein
MKKLLALMLVVVMVLSFCAIPVFGAPKGIDYNGTHYNLNLIGKDKVMPGDYDNNDRHTMFVPEYTTDFETPNGEPGVTIWMQQGEEFAVIDGNATDGTGRFQLGKGRYAVYVVSKAKPGYSTDIAGWVQYTDTTGTLYYYLKVGEISVNRKWQDAHDLFWVTTTEDTLGIISEETWVFDYLTAINNTDLYENAAYFWQYDNQGNKLVQVRFYPIN